jgi:hypothetical protein
MVVDGSGVQDGSVDEEREDEGEKRMKTRKREKGQVDGDGARSTRCRHVFREAQEEGSTFPSSPRPWGGTKPISTGLDALADELHPAAPPSSLMRQQAIQ